MRENVEPFEDDRIMYVEINKSSELISSGNLLKVVLEKVGELK
jgi:histidine ammonia-lyase